ncbi:L-lactate permease [Bacillus sp. FSL W7-1360]
MEVVLSLIPIVSILFLIFVLKKSAVFTGLITCFLTLGVALLPVFGVSVGHLLEPFFKSILTTSTIAYILFFGILLFQLLDKAGAVEGIASTISSATNDKVYQALLLALGLSPLVESVSGFGLAVIVIAPILLALGFNGVQSTLIALVSLCIIPWGTLSMGTIIGATLGNVPLEKLGSGSALLCIPIYIYFAILVGFIAVGKKETLKRLHEIVVIGAVLGVSVWLCNEYLSVELAGLFGSFTVMFVIFAMIKIKSVRNHGDIPSEKMTRKSLFLKFIAPYLFLIVTLFISRTVVHVKDVLSNNLYIDLPEYNFQLPLLYSPGFFLILSCLFAIALFRLNRPKTMESVDVTIKKCAPVIVTTLLFVAVSEMMMEAGMIAILSSVAANAFGSFFLYLSPFIGAIGGFLTGSNTASNTMFIRLQTETALQIGLSPVLLACAQNVSSSLMTMLNPSRVVLAISVCKIGDKENEILKKMMLVGSGTLTLIILQLLAVSWFVS